MEETEALIHVTRITSWCTRSLVTTENRPPEGSVGIIVKNSWSTLQVSSVRLGLVRMQLRVVICPGVLMMPNKCVSKLEYAILAIYISTAIYR